MAEDIYRFLQEVAASGRAEATFENQPFLDWGEEGFRIDAQSLTDYPPMLGGEGLRDQIASRDRRQYGLPDSWQTVVTGGATLALWAIADAFQVECLRTSPSSYAGYRYLAESLGIAFDNGDNGKRAMVVVNTPHNPDGTCLTGDDIAEVASSLRSDDVLVLDFVYDAYCFDRAPPVLPSWVVESLNPVILVNSVSKRYGLPGLRAGWMSARPDHLERPKTVVAQCTLGISAASHQIVEAIWSKDPPFEEMRRRRELCFGVLERAGLDFLRSEGGLACLVNVSADSFEFLERLVENYQISLLPGGVFGSQHCKRMRISYGYPEETIVRVVNAVSECERSFVDE